MNAYQTLSDQTKRMAYDEQLDAARTADELKKAAQRFRAQTWNTEVPDIQARLREAKMDFVSSKLVVAVSDGGDLVLHDLFIKWIQENLLRFLSVDVDSHTTSSDIRWEALTIQTIN